MHTKEKTCPLRSDCRIKADREYMNDLFKNDWEVFVIRHDKETGRHNWFTQCCETIAKGLKNAGRSIAAARR